MPRKPRKGYFVAGQFVAEGSERDLELRQAARGTDAPSRTARKHASDALQRIGEDLLTLQAERLARLALPEPLTEALAQAARIQDFEGRRRQRQYIGKLMRQLDEATLAQVRAALAEQRSGSAGETMALHQVEGWRDRLIADDGALQDWVARHPRADSQQLRALVRQARRDAVPSPAGATARHGRAYRELFALVRATLFEPPSHQESELHGNSHRDI